MYNFRICSFHPTLIHSSLFVKNLHIAHTSTMYSGVDSISNCTKPQSGVNVHQSMSNLTRSDGYACNHLLGKRCITPDHDVFCSSIKHVNHGAGHVKKQKLAMHVNTRHIGVLYHHQHGILAPAQVSTICWQIILSLTN